MDQDRLAALLELPEVQQRILSDYDGGYSLGLTRDPAKGELAIRVRVEGQAPSNIPDEIVLEGEAVPILVNSWFKLPVPLKERS